MATTTIPHRDPDDWNKLIQVTYWDCEAVGEMFEMSPGAVRARARRGDWPHLAVPGRSDRKVYWFSAEHIEEIRQRLSVSVAVGTTRLPTPAAEQPRLGLVADAEDIESIR